MQLDNEGIENVGFCSTENNELSTTESVARQMIESAIETFDTEEEMYFVDLTITGD